MASTAGRPDRRETPRAANEHGKRLYPRVTTRLSLAKVTTLLTSHLVSFCNDSSLHGLRYITTKHYHWCERLLWLLLCLLGMITSIILITILWCRFQGSPTVTTVATTSYPTWEVPFPAIMLCNNNKVYRPAALELVQNLSVEGLDKSLVLDFLHHLPELLNPSLDNVSLLLHMAKVEDHLAARGTNITTLMKKLSQPCDQMLVRCQWQGQKQDCKKLFTVQKSVEGFCCSFNYHGLTADFFEKPYDEGAISFVNGAGKNAGLSVVLDTEPNTYFGSSYYFYGLHALFHDPEDYPETSLKKALIQPGQVVWVEFDARVIESELSVRRLDTKLRECWFDDEVAEIVSYESYSYQTCVTECRITTIINNCGCIPFFYPHTNNKPTCGLRNVPCLMKLQNTLSGQRKTDTNQTRFNCRCLQQCSDKSYVIDVRNAHLAANLFSTNTLLKDLPIQNISLLHVYFGDTTCIKYRRTASMTWDALFATFGGVIGLCLGGSILSVVETVYYFTIRLLHLTHSPVEPGAPLKILQHKLLKPFSMQIAPNKLPPASIHHAF